MSKLREINCPNCGKQNTWTIENGSKPFCSSRCKLIDLGEWASEERKIPVSSSSENLMFELDDSN